MPRFQPDSISIDASILSTVWVTILDFNTSVTLLKPRGQPDMPILSHLPFRIYGIGERQVIDNYLVI